MTQPSIFFCENDFRIIVPRLIEYFKKFFIGTCIFSKSQLIISAYYHMLNVFWNIYPGITTVFLNAEEHWAKKNNSKIM